MAGIDKNTIVLLHGEDFSDSSLNPNTIENTHCTISDEGKFGKCIDGSKTTSQVLTINDLQELTSNNPFTIDFWIKLGNTRKGLLFGNGTSSIFPSFSIFIKSNNTISVHCNSTHGTDYGVEINFPNVEVIYNEFFHLAVCYDGGNIELFFNGKSKGKIATTKKIGGTNHNFSLFGRSGTNGTTAYIDEFRVSDIVRYTEDFIPYSKEYNNIPNAIIDITKDENIINFSITNDEQGYTEAFYINKAEIFINNKLSETYTSNFDNLTYIIDETLCGIGNNEIKLVVTYSDTETVEKVLRYTVNVEQLQNESTLTQVTERMQLLATTKEMEVSQLYNILIENGVEVSLKDKMSNLIEKVGTINVGIRTNVSENNLIYSAVPSELRFTNVRGTNSEIQRIILPFIGSLRVEIAYRKASSLAAASTNIILELLRDNKVVDTKTFNAGNSTMTQTVSYDFSDVRLGDILISKMTIGGGYEGQCGLMQIKGDVVQ